MLLRWFRQQVAVRTNQVRNAHAVAIRIFSGMKNVAIEVNSFFRIRKDGRNADLIAILHLELVQRGIESLVVIGFRKIEPEHGAALMSDYALNINVP